MANPTRLTWRHDGRNDDNSAFTADQFGGWELEINGQPVVSVPLGLEQDGVYEMPLADLAAVQRTGSYNLRMRVRSANGNASDWSNTATFAMDFRQPTAPSGLSVG